MVNLKVTEKILREKKYFFINLSLLFTKIGARGWVIFEKLKYAQKFSHKRISHRFQIHTKFSRYLSYVKMRGARPCTKMVQNPVFFQELQWNPDLTTVNFSAFSNFSWSQIDIYVVKYIRFNVKPAITTLFWPKKVSLNRDSAVFDRGPKYYQRKGTK